MTDKTHPVDEILPVPKLFTLGLQHVLVMYAGAIAVPLIIGRVLKLEPQDVAFLISADLFVCGIVTLLQSLGATQWFGIKLPVMMGVTFASVGPMISIALANPGIEGARMIFGAIIAAGAIAIVIAPLMSKMLRFFPPVVTGTIILVIGVTLMRIGINWIFGLPAGPTAPKTVNPEHADWLKQVGDLAAASGGTIPELPKGLSLAPSASNPLYAAPGNILVSFIVLAAILLIARYGKGFVANIAVLLGIVVGGVLAAALGMMHFDKVGGAGWFALISPFHFGAPIFEPVMILTMVLVMIVVMIRSTGMFLALGDMTDSKVTPRRLAAGLRMGRSGRSSGAFQHLPLYLVQPERRPCRRHRDQEPLYLRDGRAHPDRAWPCAEDGRPGRGAADRRPWRRGACDVRHGCRDRDPYPGLRRRFRRQPPQPVHRGGFAGLRDDPAGRAGLQDVDAAFDPSADRFRYPADDHLGGGAECLLQRGKRHGG